MLPMLASCSRGDNREDGDRGDAPRLYSKTLALAKQYADSLRAAPDSTAAIDIFRRFHSELDSLNFSVAPDTDLLLTEGENDTIYRRLQQLRALYDGRLASYAARPDTVKTETEE